jgi:hypothetical protein
LIYDGWISYRDLNDIDHTVVAISSYVIISRENASLVHSKGVYSENRRSFIGRRTLGFSVPLCRDDNNLFEIDAHGIVSAGLTATAIDLDLEFSAEFPHFEEDARLDSLVVMSNEGGRKELIGIVLVRAPNAFEPSRRRLSVSDLRWESWKGARANIRQFDPWSRVLLTHSRYSQMP